MGTILKPGKRKVGDQGTKKKKGAKNNPQRIVQLNADFPRGRLKQLEPTSWDFYRGF